MANPETGKRFDRQVAWYTKWGGLGLAVGAAAVGSGGLIIPGLILAAGGFTYESVTDPNKPKIA